MPDGPEIMENRLEERLFQKRHAGLSASSMCRANRSLDQLDVSITPLLQSFIEIRHQLKKGGNFWGSFVEPQNFHLHLFIGLICACEIALFQLRWTLGTAGGENIVAMIDQCAFTPPLMEPPITRKVRL